MPNEQTTESTVIRTGRGLSIAGTRITLYDILDYVKADWPPKLIQQWFDLSDTQIHHVMAYIAAHRDEVEVEYQLVLQQAEATRSYWEERNRARLDFVATLPPKPGQEAAIAKLRERKTKLGLS
ncbi:MAG: DUF433 domain-containing protein [Chloroflexota bacterium]|nr:DUF433 domain-containing protein [Chloroflexota bacterium]